MSTFVVELTITIEWPVSAVYSRRDYVHNNIIYENYLSVVFFNMNVNDISLKEIVLLVWVLIESFQYIFEGYLTKLQ